MAAFTEPPLEPGPNPNPSRPPNPTCLGNPTLVNSREQPEADDRVANLTQNLSQNPGRPLTSAQPRRPSWRLITLTLTLPLTLP